MNLLLKRYWALPTSTIGIIFIDTHAECFCLEDPVREVFGKPVEEWKVQNQTAIPIGRYRLAWTLSNRFKRETLQLLNINGFTGIRIHAGTTADDTEGCLLIGGMCDLDGSIYKSKLSLQRLESKVLPKIQLGEPVWLTVENP